MFYDCVIGNIIKDQIFVKNERLKTVMGIIILWPYDIAY